MARPEKLDEAKIESELATTPGWELRDGKLCRDFKFSDFVQAFGFMTRLALVAEKMDHHPEWNNVYSTVRIAMSTHDVQGLSILDFEFARRANDFFEG